MYGECGSTEFRISNNSAHVAPASKRFLNRSNAVALLVDAPHPVSRMTATIVSRIVGNLHCYDSRCRSLFSGDGGHKSGGNFAKIEFTVHRFSRDTSAESAHHIE